MPELQRLDLVDELSVRIARGQRCCAIQPLTGRIAVPLSILGDAIGAFVEDEDQVASTHPEGVQSFVFEMARWTED